MDALARKRGSKATATILIVLGFGVVVFFVTQFPYGCHGKSLAEDEAIPRVNSMFNVDGSEHWLEFGFPFSVERARRDYAEGTIEWYRLRVAEEDIPQMKEKIIASMPVPSERGQWVRVQHDPKRFPSSGGFDHHAPGWWQANDSKRWDAIELQYLSKGRSVSDAGVYILTTPGSDVVLLHRWSPASVKVTAKPMQKR